VSAEQNKALLRKWIEEGWNKGNLAVVDELYAPDFTQHDPSTPASVSSAEDLKRYVAGYRMALPDMHFETHDLVAEGDKVLWRFTATGTQKGVLLGIPPTGKYAAVTGMALFRIANGRIAECWVNFDALGLLQALGVIPAMA
jgi:steroid delta-isomerase-like uncharacterized protein